MQSEIYQKMSVGKSPEEFEDDAKKTVVDEPAHMKLLIVERGKDALDTLPKGIQNNKDRSRNNFPICLNMSLRGFAKQSPAHATRLLRWRLLAMTHLGKLFR